jgi:signal peptidase II
VILCDRLTKVLVARHIELNFGNVQVIPNFFSITHVENTGAAFSLFAEWSPRVRVPLLVGFSSLAMIVVCYLLWSSARRFTWTGLALAFILGGAIGTHMWPDFNLADSAIVCGATLLVIDLIFGSKSAHQN